MDAEPGRVVPANVAGRGDAEDSAARLRLPILFVECQAREEEILRRLQERVTHPDEVSDATSDIYLQQRDEFAPLNEVPDPCHVRFDTEADLDRELEKVEGWLYTIR